MDFHMVGFFQKYNSIFRIDTIKVVSLMQYIQEKFQLKAVRLRNVAISVQKFKNIPVYERSGKCIQSF